MATEVFNCRSVPFQKLSTSTTFEFTLMGTPRSLTAPHPFLRTPFEMLRSGHLRVAEVGAHSAKLYCCCSCNNHCAESCQNYLFLVATATRVGTLGAYKKISIQLFAWESYAIRVYCCSPYASGPLLVIKILQYLTVWWRHMNISICLFCHTL